MKKVNATLNSGEAKPALHTAKISTAANIISSISVLIAAVAVVVGMYPQIIWGNDNYAAKANAGDVYSQLFLAQYYYEIGEYKDAIYCTKPHLPHG